MDNIFEIWKWEGNTLKSSDGRILLECVSKPADKVCQLISASPMLLSACKAAMLLADEDGCLPDNGEYSGAAIGDQILCAVEMAQGAD
jgi:hypothetical protein